MPCESRSFAGSNGSGAGGFGEAGLPAVSAAPRMGAPPEGVVFVKVLYIDRFPSLL